MSYILETKELTKKYSNTTVVDNVSLTVKQGDIYGFVGKNGAGKTTFIRMLLGLTNKTSGSFRFFDGEAVNSTRKRIGSLVESPALYKNMSAKDNLALYCTMLGEDKSTIDNILETVGLSDTGKKKAADFSLGMKQRLGIAMALVGDPDFLILDEPINGLDPKGIVEVRSLLLSLQSQGKTIFISSHILGELEKIATNYGIISSGKLIEEISCEELAKKCGIRTVIKTSDPQKTLEILKKAFKEDELLLSSKSVIVKTEISDIGKITHDLFNAGITVKGIKTDESSAEDYFIKRMEE